MILVLFDIDGTLLRTRGGSIRAMRRAAEQVFGTPGEFEKVRCAGKLDPEIITEALRPCGILPWGDALERFKVCYFEALRQEVDHFRLVPGADRLVQRLVDSRKALLGLATGNFTESGFIKIEAVGLRPEWFVANAFGEEVSTRSELVRLAIERAYRWTGAKPDRIVVVGDTPRDVGAAKANGCLSVAVSAGGFSAEVLAQSGADYCAESLEPTAELLEFIFDGHIRR
ncbi:MAG: HAD hydrolase-like protein [Thermoguttaceae bacterium]|nr:HAD hydrolase-like protein [Thermoguttaceae bacterium]MDW8078729.1 HAD hydrolase-like protein [Thermoguttaceae bacterium]